MLATLSIIIPTSFACLICGDLQHNPVMGHREAGCSGQSFDGPCQGIAGRWSFLSILLEK